MKKLILIYFAVCILYSCNTGTEHTNGAPTTETKNADTEIESPPTSASNTPVVDSSPADMPKCGDVSEGSSATRTRYKINLAKTSEDCTSETQTAVCKNGSLEFDGSFPYDSCLTFADYCSDQQRKSWTKYSSSSADGDDGSKEKPFRICNKMQFLDLGMKCGGSVDDGLACSNSYYLMADIDLTGENFTADSLIGSEISPFSGSFHGNNFTVSGVNVDLSATVPPVDGVGLFLKTTGGFGIRDLKVNGSVKGVFSVGMVVGRSMAPLINVHSSGTVTARSIMATGTGVKYYATRAGGIAGFHSASEITDCSSSAVVDTTAGFNEYISNSRYGGGIVGESLNSSLSNSAFSGKVYSYSYVGGIAGRTVNTNFSKLTVSGEIHGIYALGGIVGQTENANTNDVKKFNSLASSVFNGTISIDTKFLPLKAPQSQSNIGGIVGIARQLNIYNAKNRSSLIFPETTLIGGIAGNIESGIIYGVENSGNIHGLISVGGIAGRSRYTDFTNSVVTGSITAYNRGGGVIGEAFYAEIFGVEVNSQLNGGSEIGGLNGYSEETKIFASKVNAAITADGSSVGGVVGAAYGFSVEQSFFKGTITVAGTSAGGLIGSTFGANTYINNSYAVASVLGAGSVGGLIGHCRNNQIKDSYFTGTVTATNSNGLVGGLIGYRWDSSCMVNDSFYSAADVTLRGVSNTIGEVGSKEVLMDSVRIAWDFFDVWTVTNDSNSGWPALIYFDL